MRMAQAQVVEVRALQTPRSGIRVTNVDERRKICAVSAHHRATRRRCKNAACLASVKTRSCTNRTRIRSNRMQLCTNRRRTCTARKQTCTNRTSILTNRKPFRTARKPILTDRMHFATNRKPFCSDRKRILTNRKPILMFIPRSPASVTADRPDGCKRGRAGGQTWLHNHFDD